MAYFDCPHNAELWIITSRTFPPSKKLKKYSKLEKTLKLDRLHSISIMYDWYKVLCLLESTFDSPGTKGDRIFFGKNLRLCYPIPKCILLMCGESWGKIFYFQRGNLEIVIQHCVSHSLIQLKYFAFSLNSSTLMG